GHASPAITRIFGLAVVLAAALGSSISPALAKKGAAPPLLRGSQDGGQKSRSVAPAPAEAAEEGEVKTAQTVRTYNLTLPLIFQGTYLGDIPVAASPDGNIAVNVERFVGLLGERLSPEMTAALRLLAGGEQVVAIEQFAPAGIVIAYDT